MIRTIITGGMLNCQWLFHANNLMSFEGENEHIGVKYYQLWNSGAWKQFLWKLLSSLVLQNVSWPVITKLNAQSAIMLVKFLPDYSLVESWYCVSSKMCLPWCLIQCLRHAWRGSVLAPLTVGSSLHHAPRTRLSDNCATQWHPAWAIRNPIVTH